MGLLFAQLLLNQKKLFYRFGAFAQSRAQARLCEGLIPGCCRRTGKDVFKETERKERKQEILRKEQKMKEVRRRSGVSYVFFKKSPWRESVLERAESDSHFHNK